MKTNLSTYSHIALAAGVLGFVSTFSQLFLVREFLAVFYGNELVIGIILFSWIFLSGIGSYIAILLETFKSPMRLVYGGFLALSIFPMLSYLLLGWLYPLFLHQGQMASLMDITIIALLTLLPVCLLNGILFSLFSQVFQKTAFISKNYAFESIGGLLGGVLIYFWSGNSLDATTAFFGLGILTAISALLLAKLAGHFRKIVSASAITVVLLFGMTQIHPNNTLNVNAFGNQTVVYQKNTNAGKLTVTQLSEQLNVFLNGYLWYDTGACASCEEMVHFTLSQRKSVDNVLLVGGGITPMPCEILKYKPAKLVYTEFVPELVDFSITNNPMLSNSSVSCIKGDIFQLFKDSPNAFDAVIINIPEPYSAAINRYYTSDFFRKAKNQLSAKGIFTISLPSYNDFCTDGDLVLHATVYNTLKSVFAQVVIITGQRNYFLASNYSISTGVVQINRQKPTTLTQLDGKFVNDSALKITSAAFQARLEKQAVDINSVLKPSSNLGQLSYWISNFGKTNWILLVVGIIFFGYFILKLNGVGRSVFLAGFSCLALEMIIMVIYQSICGTIYKGSGIIISTFMAGMALGFLVKLPNSRRYQKSFSNMLILLGVICILPIIVVINESHFTEFHSFTAFSLLFIGFVFSFFTGHLFSLGVACGRGSVGQVVAKTYGADMLGASLGALLVSSYLIPRFGVETVSAMLFLMLLSAGIILKLRK